MKAGLAVGLIIPDLWQQEAVRALHQGKDVVVQAPTGSGKTYRDSQSRCPASRPSMSPSSRNVGPSQRYL
jgi:RAD3-like DEAD/DEAH box helicase